MEHGRAINHKVALLESASLLNELRLLSQGVDILPQDDIHPAQRIVEAACPLHSQKLRVVLKHFTLVVKVIDHLKLLEIGRALHIKILVNVGLS